MNNYIEEYKRLLNANLIASIDKFKGQKTDYPNAISYLQKGITIAEKAGQKNNQSALYQDMKKCYEAINDFKTAYVYANR